MIENNGDNKPELSAAGALALLQWQSEMGADEAIGDAPLDRFALCKEEQHTAPTNPLRAKAERPPAESAPRPAPSRPAAASMSTDEAVLAARYLAHEARTLDELRRAMDGFEGCGLRATAKQLVFAAGNPAARLMLIGEAPGRDEDLQGFPFVGRAGQLLDKMLAAIGLDRNAEDPEHSAYITNVVPWRPPGNRNPTAAETAICRPFIDRHMELANPEIVLFLGGVAAKEMYRTQTGIMRLRGKWRQVETDHGEFRTFATFHPSFLLRSPAQKRLAWRDLLDVRRALDEEDQD